MNSGGNFIFYEGKISERKIGIGKVRYEIINL